MPYQRALAHRFGFELGSPEYETPALPTELSRLLQRYCTWDGYNIGKVGCWPWKDLEPCVLQPLRYYYYDCKAFDLGVLAGSNHTLIFSSKCRVFRNYERHSGDIITIGFLTSTFLSFSYSSLSLSLSLSLPLSFPLYFSLFKVVQFFSF